MSSTVLMAPGRNPLEALVRELWSHRPKPVLLGGGLSIPAATALSAVLVSQHRKVIFVDGATRFNPYNVARCARRIGCHPKEILDAKHFLFARAFTCHQLTVLLEEKVRKHLDDGPAILVASGPLNTFMDESVPWREVRALFRRLKKSLFQISETSSLLLAQHSVGGPRERHGLMRGLSSAAETMAIVEASDGGPQVKIVKPERKVIRAGEALALITAQGEA